MAGWLYILVLTAASSYVLARGDRDIRVAALLIIATSVVTLVNYRAISGTFAWVQPWLLVVEGVALVVVLAIAFRSSRFWPLVFAATQIATLLSLLTPLFGRGLVSYALGVAQGMWAYPQLLVLVLATIRGRNRALRQRSPAMS